MSGWLHTKTAYPRTVTDLSTNHAQRIQYFVDVNNGITTRMVLCDYSHTRKL